MSRGFSLVELMVTIAVAAVLASTVLVRPGLQQQRLELETAMRRLRVGLDRARLAAERNQQPCGLSLGAQGWQKPHSSALPVCPGALLPLRESAAGGSPDTLISLRTNLPELLRFTANGLVLDGGVVVLRHTQMPLQRCLVLGLPLGITRTGRYEGDSEQPLSSSHCRPSDDG